MARFQISRILDFGPIRHGLRALFYAKSKTQIENGKRHFSIWIFLSEEKIYLMLSDFDDFRATFFDLAFSITTSYRNGGELRSEKMTIEKYRATRYQGVWMTHSQKPRGNTRDAATHTPEPKAHKSIRRHGIIVDSCADYTAFYMHSSLAVATTDGCCCCTIILLPPARRFQTVHARSTSNRTAILC